jgi:hypothetical protein
VETPKIVQLTLNVENAISGDFPQFRLNLRMLQTDITAFIAFGQSIEADASKTQSADRCEDGVGLDSKCEAMCYAHDAQMKPGQAHSFWTTMAVAPPP